MPFYLIMVGVMCAAPIKEDALNREWTPNDEWVMQTGIKECRNRYEGRSPCLRRIIKLEAFQDYKLMCGAALRTEK